MDITRLSIAIERLADALAAEEEKYVNGSELRHLSSTQIRYVDAILHRDGITVSEMARLLDVSKPSVTIAVDRLKKTDLVWKSRDEHDGRVQRLHLTERGRSMALLHERFHEVFTADLAGNLSEQEAATLSALLTKALG